MVGSIQSKTGWTTYTYDLTIDANRVGDKGEVGAIAFNLGQIETNVYIKNVSLVKEVVNTGDQTVEKTPEEKKAILTDALGVWIKGIKEVATYVKAWDVVNEPMSDWPDPNQLKTGVGKTDMAANEFYWQDYLGKDYAAIAIQLARKYGNPDDKLFINDYGLEGGNMDKCNGLIAFVKYTDDVCQTMGVKGVDGIGTQMHISLDTDTNKIVEMFKLLAATGKLIKISELDMGLGGNPATITPNATNEQYLQQAKLYRFVVEQYFKNIPAAQRYGITQWALTDSPAGSGWRPNEPIGLWTLDYNRKHAYGGFANGLAGRDISVDKK
jgi:GH35 family endo-1,4-beta-xylanase